MLRRSRVSLAVLVSLVSVPALAQDPASEPAPAEPPPPPPPLPPPPLPAAVPPPTAALPDAAPPIAQPPSTTDPAALKPVVEPGAWQTSVGGYFRTPVSIGISSRPGPDNPDGPASRQLSYGPNRTVDSSYYSFAYTRLQEQDWAEMFVHARKRHVDAAVGWMGYWFQSVGFRNPDASWAPGLAYLALDSDFRAASFNPNIEVKMGAFWPSYGYFEKYDTYTLGRFRQLGEQLKLTVPLDGDSTVVLVHGFGTGRDGHWTTNVNPLYSTTTAIDLLTWANIQYTYKKNVDAGIHFNTQWTSDPNLAPGSVPDGKSYQAFKVAHLTVVGAEATLRAPYWGRLWVSPSFIHVRNGWALANGGTEVMHSLGGVGIATSYLGWNNSTPDSTGSGSMLNLGFMYENTLSGIQGKASGDVPEVTVSVFGLLADASLDLPNGSSLKQKSVKQFKWGADARLQSLTWLAFMLRFDAVNYDLDHPGFVFASITPRAIVSSHFLSSERIYIQYSRYFYGDKMVLAGTWPWGVPLVAGTDILQGGTYAGKKPDENVVKLQADIAF